MPWKSGTMRHMPQRSAIRLAGALIVRPAAGLPGAHTEDEADQQPLGDDEPAPHLKNMISTMAMSSVSMHCITTAGLFTADPVAWQIEHVSCTEGLKNVWLVVW